MANDDYEKHQDSEELKKFEDMMRGWAIEVPLDFGVPPHMPSDKTTTKSDQTPPYKCLLLDWCMRNFEQPKDAEESLRKGQRLVEASTALFGYSLLLAPCFVSCLPYEGVSKDAMKWFAQFLLKGVPGALESLNEGTRPTEKDVPIMAKHIDRYKNYSSQLECIKKSFSMDQIGLQSESIVQPVALPLQVQVLVGAALILLGKKGANHHPPTLELVRESYLTVIKMGKREPTSLLDKQNTGEDNIISGDVIGFLTAVACAIVCNSFGHVATEIDGDCYTAFLAYAKAIELISVFYALDGDDIRLPYTQNGCLDFDELKHIVHIWEEVKARPGKAVDWLEMEKALQKIWAFVLDVDWQNEELSADVPAQSYFMLQTEYCKSKMDTRDLINHFEEEKRSWHTNRMKLDFFSGLWESLGQSTRESIISAESEWYDGPDRGSNVKAAIEHYSSAFECEIHDIIFGLTDVQNCVTKILKQREFRKQFRLSSRNANSLSLLDMSKLLRCVRESRAQSIWQELLEPVQRAINTLPVDVAGRDLLTDKRFTDFLAQVYNTRNKRVHRRNDKNDLNQIKALRQKALGIGRSKEIRCDGYMVELARIERQIREPVVALE